MKDFTDSLGHVIDSNLYLDSGGGRMCVNCGLQGSDLDKPCSGTAWACEPLHVETPNEERG